MKAYYKNDIFLQQTKNFGNAAAFLTKATFSNLQAFKNRTDMTKTHILNQNIQNFLKVTKDSLYKATMTLNNHNVAINMLTNVSTAFANVLRKYT